MPTPILGEPWLTARAASCFAARRGAPLWFCDLTDLYWAPDATGVRPDVAFAQACKETGFGRFGRAVTREHHNFCGLKVPQPSGADDDPDDHMRFGNDAQGVLAHKEHLAVYAASPGFPRPYEKTSPTTWKGATADSRHFAFILGRATTVEALGGNWAPAFDYGESIRDDYLTPMIQYAWGQAA